MMRIVMVDEILDVSVNFFKRQCMVSWKKVATCLPKHRALHPLLDDTLSQLKKLFHQRVVKVLNNSRESIGLLFLYNCTISALEKDSLLTI